MKRKEVDPEQLKEDVECILDMKRQSCVEDFLAAGTLLAYAMIALMCLLGMR